MTLPQNLVRAMRQIVADPGDSLSVAAALPLFESIIKREDAKPVRKVGGGTKRRKGQDGPTDTTKEAVWTRSRGFCEVAAIGCYGPGTQLHHRLMRSQGGRHDAGNLLHVCAMCHDYIHAHPTYAYERGWLLHRETV